MAMVTAQGVDYSLARPSPVALRSGGKTFACRYYSPPKNGKPNPKCLTNAEARALMSSGVAVVGNFEQDTGNALKGFAQGVIDARVAHQQQHDCATPTGAWDQRPIYFSVDFDASNAQMATVAAYFDGVASVIGHARVGAYGGYYVIKYLFDHGKITWGWQTYAWSGGHWDARAHIQQYQNNVMVAGGACDLDRAMKADFGQWGIGAQPTTREMFSMLTDAQQQQMFDTITGLAWGSPTVSGTMDANGKPYPNCPVQWEVAREALEKANTAKLDTILSLVTTIASASGGLSDADRALMQTVVDADNAAKAAIDSLNSRLSTP